jgi:hypothetical protein
MSRRADAIVRHKKTRAGEADAGFEQYGKGTATLRYLL